MKCLGALLHSCSTVCLHVFHIVRPSLMCVSRAYCEERLLQVVLLLFVDVVFVVAYLHCHIHVCVASWNVCEPQKIKIILMSASNIICNCIHVL